MWIVTKMFPDWKGTTHFEWMYIYRCTNIYYTFHTFSVHVLPPIFINISFNDMQVIETLQEFKHSIFKCQTCHIYYIHVHTSFLAWPNVFVYCLPSIQWYSNVKNNRRMCVIYSLQMSCNKLHMYTCIYLYVY